MEDARKNQVLEILDYWETIEFLDQKDIPVENPDNKKLIEKIQKGEKTGRSKIEIFMDLTTAYVNIDDQLDQDGKKYPLFPSAGAEICFCLGRIERNLIVEYLQKYVETKEDIPELAYPKKSAIAWCSFKTDTKGEYLEGSFQLSPILWALLKWENSKAQKEQVFHLKTGEYDNVIKKEDEELQDENVMQFLPKLYEKIQKNYVKKIFPDAAQDSIGFMEYNRYKNEKDRNEDEDPADYADLGRSFYLDDITQLSYLIKDEQFGDNSVYEKKVIDYILAGYEKNKGIGEHERMIISPKESPAVMKKFFEEILRVDHAPMGKWPAKFMPALMQQIAVNIAIKQDDTTPIFSVNGPPGTGKTTLLKEIVASNIVERAKLLADNGDDPDSLFDRHSFIQGPLKAYDNAYYQHAPYYYSIKNDEINNYSMLVASCNNAAVENITIDLPKGRDILESLEPSREDERDVRQGLEEVRDLFDVKKSTDVETITMYGKSSEEPDIYFTRYANDLLGMDECWGLISAPLGKRANVKRYCNGVLKPFIETYRPSDREAHKKKFERERRRFLDQYKRVEKMKVELRNVCSLASNISTNAMDTSIEDLSRELDEIEKERQKVEAKIKAEEKELMELEESRPRFFFALLSKTSTRDALMAEKKETIRNLELELNEIKKHHEEKLDEIKKCCEEIRNLQEYQKTMDKYSQGAKKLTPIDDIFMSRYVSSEEKESTDAQVTNPWFTAEYNREREKLFLYACKLHKEFVISSKCMWHNIINLMIAWKMFDDCSERMKKIDRKSAMPYLLQSIFLLTPVISTTFAAAQTFLGDIEKRGILGTLIVDEAGQAQPQMAVGAMFRCRKAVIVGDPKQIEPVVTAETDMIKQLFDSKVLASYKDKKISVQGFADYINPYGTYLGEEEEREWVGCPLVVHRRCIDPMYTISNFLSYDGTMKQQTGAPKEEREKTFILKKSCWIDVTGNEDTGNKNHFVKAQGEVALELLEEKFKKDSNEIPRLFIITPFTSVKNGMLDMIRKSALFRKEPRVKKWLDDNNVGTVHTFQGQGTDEVIFLLGCDSNSMGAANWVNKNIVNVAATRAKFRFYMIGDKTVWMCKPVKIARELISETISREDLKQKIGAAEGSQHSVKSVSKKGSPVGGKASAKMTTRSTDVQGKEFICPWCGKSLKERTNRINGSKFLGCTGYPDCKYNKNLKAEDI